jgi:hypothetical protein
MTANAVLAFEIVQPGRGIAFTANGMFHLTVNANDEPEAEFYGFEGVCQV